MQEHYETDPYVGPVYRAGEKVPPGTYKRIDGRGRRELRLEHEDTLPASLDGRVAYYQRVQNQNTWAVLSRTE